PGDMANASGAGNLDQEGREVRMRNRLASAYVEDLAIHAVRRARAEERIHRVLHVDEITNLRAVPENLNLTAFEGQPDEPADESLAVVFDQLARTVHVRQAERTGREAKHVVVEDVGVLAGSLIDAVDIHGPYQMCVRDGHE